MHRRMLPAMLFIFFLCSPILSTESMQLVEEGKDLWEELLKDNTIVNKNLLYAGYVAYREKFNELSIESFKECITINPNNEIIKGISNYYIGKNLFYLGKYGESITYFSTLTTMKLGTFNHLKTASLINTAVSYYRNKDTGKFKSILNGILKTEQEERYRKIAEKLLSSH